jgi:hypothetical protein
MFTWPTELDDATTLLQVVGSFWAETYAGNVLVASLLHAKAQQQAQAHLDLLELVAAISRFSVPVFHRENWTLLELRESELNQANVPKFDGTYQFDGTIRFDQPVTTDLFVWEAPERLESVSVILNQITDSTTTYVHGVDFLQQDGLLQFRTNPFTRDNVRIETVFDGSVPVDRIAYLWAYGGEFDWQTVYTQFGYVLGLRLRSSPNYRKALNAIFDSLTYGTSARTVEELFAAICDAPLCQQTEKVTDVIADHRKRWILTPQNVYAVNLNAEGLPAVGDTINTGDMLGDAVQFFDFNRGVTPTQLRALALGAGVLASGYYQELVFENKETPLIVEDDVDGYTKVSFEIGGWPLDIEKFWEDTHNAGVQMQDTLAMRLDQRENKATQPTAIALPATINPLRFLIENVLRGNAFAIVCRPRSFGPAALGLHVARYLRKIVPPQTLCLLVVQLDGSAETVTMAGSGTETQPGYTETVVTFTAQTTADTVGPEYVTDELRVTRINGYCS